MTLTEIVNKLSTVGDIKVAAGTTTAQDVTLTSGKVTCGAPAHNDAKLYTTLAKAGNVQFAIAPKAAKVTPADIADTFTSYDGVDNTDASKKAASENTVTLVSTDTTSRLNYDATANNSTSSLGTLDKTGALSFGSVAPSITLPKNIEAGTYPVKLLAKITTGNSGANATAYAYAEFNIVVSGSSSNNNNGQTDNGVFTYGGVLNNIYAYKGASYDLAEHAAIKYDGVNYSGSELEWYLVDASKTPTLREARSDLKSINMPADAGTVESGAAGSLKVTVSDPAKFNNAITNGSAGTKIVAEAVVNGVRTVVYVAGSKFTATNVTENAVSKVIEVSANVQASGIASKDNKLAVLDTKIANPTKDNIYLKAKEVTYPVGSYKFTETDAHYALTVVKGSGDDNPFKGSFLTLENGDNLPAGTYYETEYIPFKVGSDTNTLYLLKVNTTVSVNTGVQFRVKDAGSILASTFTNDKIATDHAVYLNLTDAKTWNIKDYIEADVPDLSKVSFTFSSDSANADVDSNGVITAKSVGNAVITIKASYNGLESSTDLTVRVNKNGFDTITVTGKDGENARVLAPRDYDNNSVSVVTSEENLVTKQIPYVQIEITGNETTNVTETPVVASKNNAKLSYAFVKDYSSKGLVIDPSTGKITIDYTKCTDGTSTKVATAMGVYAVKVVSNETNTSAATTSYYYVVVDYPDQTISGLEDNYTVGSCADTTDVHANAVEMYKESKTSAKSFRSINKTTDDFNGVKYYADDNVKAFDHDSAFATDGIIVRAYTAGQTEHVLAYNTVDPANKAGYTAKLITVKSAAADDNYVTKITNKETGEVLYDHAVNASDTARELKIDKATTVQVTLAHPVASVVSGSAVGLKIAAVDDNNHIYNETPYVTAVVNSKEVDVALYPNSKGTTVIQIGPSGHLTATNRTDIHHKYVNVAVTYTGEASADAKNPAQVKGVKVSNKKGAKVTVKFNKITANSTMRYYVQKKVGKKVSGKSIGSTKTTLSVKKGATVKVRVKAYYYDANGVKHVGKYSSWKTLKTDKK